jgi:RNA polymerase sigma-70 factor (ECF subfamily)
MTEFESLYRRHAPELFRYVLRLCGNRAEAEDVVSETFVRALNANANVRAATARAYLFAIARNCYLQGLRRKARQVPLDEELVDLAADLHDAARKRAELRRVLRALQEMPEIDRSILLLRAQEGLPYEEIAQAVGLPVTTVKVRMHRARRRLVLFRTGQETPK